MSESILADRIVLSTGRVFEPESGLVSVRFTEFECPNEFVLYEGYDSRIFGADDFTNAEKREIAEWMIARWTKFRDSLEENP